MSGICSIKLSTPAIRMRLMRSKKLNGIARFGEAGSDSSKQILPKEMHINVTGGKDRLNEFLYRYPRCGNKFKNRLSRT
jgi:hypothetical protein